MLHRPATQLLLLGFGVLFGLEGTFSATTARAAIREFTLSELTGPFSPGATTLEINFDLPPAVVGIGAMALTPQVEYTDGTVICCYFEDEPCSEWVTTPTLRFIIDRPRECGGDWIADLDYTDTDGRWWFRIDDPFPGAGCLTDFDRFISEPLTLQVVVEPYSFVLACDWAEDQIASLSVTEVVVTLATDELEPVSVSSWGRLKALFE